MRCRRSSSVAVLGTALITMLSWSPCEGAPESRPALTTQEDDGVPRWAKLYTDGLKAWRDIIYYWIDRQRPDGTFGFGWGDDCEMIVGWPGVMMAADDKRIERSIERLADNQWYNPNVQQGYVARATDAEHGPEPISYTNPVLLYQQFGSPRLIERLMVTAKNVEHWTGMTPRGDRHMRASYFGSQQLYEWGFYGEDSPINARAWVPMMHLLLYNRDPHLMKYYLEWTAAWAKHAMEDVYGKPPGILPGTVSFATGEPGAFTKNWWGAGAHDFSSLWYQTRMHGTLVAAYVLTGDDKYVAPLREMLRFFSTYARPAVEKGQPLPPDRLPQQYRFPEGWRDGTISTQWARDVALGHPGGWYYYVTGDTQFDEAYEKLLRVPIKRGPFERIDMDIVEQGARRAKSFRDDYFEKLLPKLRVGQGDSIANYAAAFWQKHYGTMTFGPRCFHDGGKLANSVNWPWVDFPPPAVTWKDTGYDTAIFVLEDSPQRFRVALCNVSHEERSIGAQLFTLDEGTYAMRLGPDADEDGKLDAVTQTDRMDIRRGDLERVKLPPKVTMLLELERTADSGPVPPWRPRPDLGLDPWDVMISDENPAAGSKVTVTVRVHNIGAAPTERVSVMLVGSGLSEGQSAVVQGLGEKMIERIDPPKKLTPSHVDVTFDFSLPAGVEHLTAWIDPGRKIHELYERNNRVDLDLADLRTVQPLKEFRQYEPARRPSLADVTRTDLSRYDVPFRSGIKVDGRIDNAEWKDVPAFEFIAHSDGGRPKKRTWMQMAYDDQSLYLAFRCEEPDLELLDTHLSRIDDIYYKDGFEIFLDPGATVWRYWQSCFDTVPHKLQVLSRNRYAEQAPWDVAVAEGDDEWTAEVRFPFSSFDVGPPEAGSRWRMNAMRFTTTFRDPRDPGRQVPERSHFSPQGKLHGHHQPELFGDLYFLPR